MAIPDVLAKFNLSRKISAQLTTPYNIMITFFLRCFVKKAFHIDEYLTSLSFSLNKPIDASSPLIILAVDMFIVNAMIQKSLATSQKEIVAYVITAIGQALGSDFVA